MLPVLANLAYQYGAAFVPIGTGPPSKPAANRHDTPHASLDFLKVCDMAREAGPALGMGLGLRLSSKLAGAAVEQVDLKRTELDLTAKAFRLSLVESTLNDKDASEPAKKVARQLRDQMVQESANPQGSLPTPSPDPAPSPPPSFIIDVCTSVCNYILDQCKAQLKEQLSKVASQGVAWCTTVGERAIDYGDEVSNDCIRAAAAIKAAKAGEKEGAAAKDNLTELDTEQLVDKTTQLGEAPLPKEVELATPPTDYEMD